MRLPSPLLLAPLGQDGCVEDKGEQMVGPNDEQLLEGLFVKEIVYWRR